MNTKLQYDLHEIGDASQKAIVAIHGWQGDCNSMYPLIKSMNIKNVGWYLLEAPFPVKNGEGFSWSYEKSNGQWEIDEPRRLLNVFFGELFKIYDSRKIFVMGFSQGGLVCFDFVLFLQIKDKYIPINVSIQFVNFLLISCANYEYRTPIRLT